MATNTVQLNNKWSGKSSYINLSKAHSPCLQCPTWRTGTHRTPSPTVDRSSALTSVTLTSSHQVPLLAVLAAAKVKASTHWHQWSIVHPSQHPMAYKPRTTPKVNSSNLSMTIVTPHSPAVRA